MTEFKRDANCIFCQVIERTIKSDVVFEGEDHIAIRDINPQAPCHILVVPKEHVADVREAGSPLLGNLLQAASSIALSQGLAEGFRLVVNTGALAGQTVFHLHIHVLGGRAMGWPPG